MDAEYAVIQPDLGKTRTALTAIELLLKKNPNAVILISVPTEVLKEQWISELIKRGIFSNCKVEVINTIVKGDWDVDLLVQDEIHICGSQTYSQIFERVNYNFILGLTGTLERLDGKEVLIKQYCPVCDIVTMDEAIKNKWVAPVKEYAVLLDVDLTEYNEWNRKFNGFFSFFNYDFSLAMNCVKSVIDRRKYAKLLGVKESVVTANAMSWMKCLRARKEFIMSHPKKLEVAKKILNARQDKKCIVFCSTIKDCEKLKMGVVLHSKQKKKQNAEILTKFNEAETGIISSSRALNTGVDIKGLSVGIILNTNSSKIIKVQSRGRVCRFEEGKEAELFTILIKGTQEVTWHANASTGSHYQTINESQLDKVLAGEIIETRERENVEDKKFRF